MPDREEVSDWASFFGDLSRPHHEEGQADEPVEWRVHDKTHLEFAIDYPVARSHPTKRVWEAYFFVPESFRIHEATYSKKAIYEDLQSYVRYAVPEMRFEEIVRFGDGAILDKVSAALQRTVGTADDSPEAHEATRLLRLYACLVRASGLDEVRRVERNLTGELESQTLRREAIQFVIRCDDLARAFRAVVAGAERRGLPDEVLFALKWTDEATSIALETMCADLALRLERDTRVEAVHPDLAEQVASHAVSQATYRQERGYDSVGRAGASEREVEHLEFRRHVLKRFTASVLWLALEVREGRWWAVHVFYAFAAALAMTFAVAAALGTSRFSDNVLRYALLVIVAYAIKDRMKAFLQDYFNRWVASRFPDRLWTIRDHERQVDVGKVRERAGFVPFALVPRKVLEKRRLTREHAVEEIARAERVLWHEKEIEIEAGVTAQFPMLTEIFRLNVGHWLVHTDDPKRKVLFADPDDASIYSAVARRVYNLGVVYRLRGEREDSEWHRIRVVVSRKGILRIEPIC
ncbi:MAG: hypothetical protein ACXVEF_01180 [Polyangiales bacterium]